MCVCVCVCVCVHVHVGVCCVHMCAAVFYINRPFTVIKSPQGSNFRCDKNCVSVSILYML